MLSILLSVVAYSLTRSNLVEQRQDVVFENARTNAFQLDNRLLTASVSPTEYAPLLEQLLVLEGFQLGLFANGVYSFVDPIRFSSDDLHPAFQAAVERGEAVDMNFKSGEESFYAVAIPMKKSEVTATYIEAASLDDLARTFNTLLLTLLGASAVTTVLGLGFGVYTANRLFSPLGDISEAASSITEGDLSTRLRETSDPDLQGLIHSFNEMTSALETRVQRDARFASDVSHELRSPLMTLTGSVAVLERRRDELPERSQVALDLLSTDIRRFKLLVEDLLEISRFDIGAVQLQHEEVLFTEFVRQAILVATTGEGEVTFVHDSDVTDVIIAIDKRRVAQVIRNLSENADKYAGGVTQIRLSVIDGDGVQIDLEDEGPGVPRDERELVFDRFARGSEGGRRGSGSGVGLGLSLVREHLALHGGTVLVTDRVDQNPGARFVVRLPGVVAE